MNKWTMAALGAVLAVTVATPALAHGHRSHASKKVRQQEQCSTCEYAEAMEKMHHAMMINYTGDTDIDFAAGMMPHHQGAIDMANIELKYGKDPEMRWLARWIIQEQVLEKGTMYSWIRGRLNANASTYVTPQVGEYKAAMEKMHHAMMISYTGDADVDFARGMIPHHRGAIDMAAVEKISGKNPAMHDLALSIFNTQQGEIGIMQRWLDKHPASVAAEKPAPKSKMKKKHHKVKH